MSSCKVHQLPAQNQPDLQQLQQQWQQQWPALPVQQRMQQALQILPRAHVLSSSFGMQAAVMLHVFSSIDPDMPVIFIDTGYHFAETYRFVDQLTKRFKLNLKVYNPIMTAARQEALYGKLWEQGEQGLKRYHTINKVEPMQRALRELDPVVWLAGLRADQTRHRATLRTVERQDGRLKVHPILGWTSRDLHGYLKAHDLPYHPLWEQGYVSIGDVHSTRPITADEQDERDVRFGGAVQECGLHLPTSEAADAVAEQRVLAARHLQRSWV